ncbi:hypothetical protein Tco_0912380 [Tanacetum coccineum]
MATAEVAQTLKYRGGQLNAALVLEVENFTNWKKRAKWPQWTTDGEKLLTLDQLSQKVFIMCRLLQIPNKSVINCLTAKKSTWDDHTIFMRGPDFQDSPDDEEDTRSSHEYLNDLEEEYQERALLAKSKRFFKKGTQRFSTAKATDQTKCHTCGKKGHFARDYWSKTSVPSYQSPFQSKLLSSKNKPEPRSHDEEVSSNENKVTEVKALIELTDEERVSIGKESARNDDWTKISKKKVHTLLEMEDNDDRKNFLDYLNTTDPSVLIADSSITDYDSADESSVYSTPLLSLKKLDGAETQYENFTAPSSEMLDQTFDRLQNLMSQLDILDEKLSQEDVNQKLLRSLSPEWNTHAVVWRNKADLDTMSMDDLYNNLKVYEPEVKGMSSSSSSTQNMAFVSSSNNNTSNCKRLRSRLSAFASCACRLRSIARKSPISVCCAKTIVRSALTLERTISLASIDYTQASREALASPSISLAMRAWERLCLCSNMTKYVYPRRQLSTSVASISSTISSGSYQTSPLVGLEVGADELSPILYLGPGSMHNLFRGGNVTSRTYVLQSVEGRRKGGDEVGNSIGKSGGVPNGGVFNQICKKSVQPPASDGNGNMVFISQYNIHGKWYDMRVVGRSRPKLGAPPPPHPRHQHHLWRTPPPTHHNPCQWDSQLDPPQIHINLL